MFLIINYIYFNSIVDGEVVVVDVEVVVVVVVDVESRTVVVVESCDN